MTDAEIRDAFNILRAGFGQTPPSKEFVAAVVAILEGFFTNVARIETHLGSIAESLSEGSDDDA
jgi:hypothetical protein